MCGVAELYTLAMSLTETQRDTFVVWLRAKLLEWGCDGEVD